MRLTNYLLAGIVVLVATYFGFVVFQQETLSDMIRPFILPLVVVLYCASGFKKSTYFFLFLLIYAIAELVTIVYYYIDESQLVLDIFYYGCNTLYITAYIFLTLDVLRHMELRNIIKKFFVHLIILLILDIYSIILVTEIAVKSGMLESNADYVLEFIYNVVIMGLLTITLINYLHRDTKKAMNLLIGALCIVFSEVIQVAYFYVTEISLLSIAYNLLLILAFIFFYIQIGMSAEEHVRKEDLLEGKDEVKKDQLINKAEA